MWAPTVEIDDESGQVLGKQDPDPSYENMALDNKIGKGNRGAEREACGSTLAMQVPQFAANATCNFNNWTQTQMRLFDSD
jgi:hypothetical protein